MLICVNTADRLKKSMKALISPNSACIVMCVSLDLLFIFVGVVEHFL